MTPAMLKIKLYAPPLRYGLVKRPHLMTKLNEGLQRGVQLTLISAPAGYGKTTLAREWLEGLPVPYTWLSLDGGDNHPVEFMSYFTAALQQVDPSIRWQSVERPASFDGVEERSEWLREQMMGLINQVAASPERFVLVLDDYHAISELAVHEAMAFLLEYQPPQMHLVITTRQDPLLPLSKLRSRGRLTEIRLGELRFTADEVALFLNGTMQLNLPPEQIASLGTRTEGWIAGLQLAGLSLAAKPPGGDGTSDYIRTFADDDRHIVDYLMDEVLSRLPDGVQQFLLQTSILSRLCAPLCDAVLGAEAAEHETPSPEPASYSQQILDRLEQGNVFIIPLDTRRQWYRYHHLFADLLQSRLQTLASEQVSALHERASRWYERAGLTNEAVDHALLAEDVGRALSLIEQSASRSIWASGDLPTLLNWSARLPEAALLARPNLCLYYARGLFFRGQVEAAQRYLDTAGETLSAREGTDDPPAPELWGVYFTNSATFAAMRGDAGEALELADRALALLPDDDSGRARVAHAVGVAESVRGNVREAERAFLDGMRLAERAGNDILGMDLVSCLAMVRLHAGCLPEAEQVCVRALSDPAKARLPAASAVYLAYAEVRFEQNRLDEAREALGRCLERAHRAGWVHVLWRAYVLQARIAQAQGDDGRVREALERAERVVQGYPLPIVRRQLDAARAALGAGAAISADAASAGQLGLAEPLTERELEVLACVAEGLTNPEIAERLYLSPNTVRVHTSNIYGKLGVHNRVEAVLRAQELGLLPEA